MATIAEQLTSLANTKTAIKDAIVAKGVSVADTDPFSAYPTKIGQISGGGATTKFGVSIDNLLGSVEADGGLSNPENSFVFNGGGIKKITYHGALAFRFHITNWTEARFPDLMAIGDGGAPTYNRGYCQNAFSNAINYLDDRIVDMPNLEEINGQYAAQDMFNLSYVDNINIPKLTMIKGTSAAQSMFNNNTLSQARLPSLTTISGSSAAIQMFANNYIESVDLSSLATVSGSGACRQMFQNNKTLPRVDFPSLVSVEANCFGTSATNAIFAGCAGLLEIHFRADAQAVIEALTAYQYRFGATNATIYFDL